MADPATYGNHERNTEQVFFTLKKGTQLVKYSRKGKPKFCPFRLSPDEASLIWISRGKEKKLSLSSVTRIIAGQRTAVFRRYLRPEKDYLSFSLIYKKGERSLDLICKDKVEVEVWFEGLKALISTGPRIRRTKSDFTDDSIDLIQNDRPSIGTLEFTSSIAHGRFSVDSDVGPERANMPIRTSIGDGSRVSVSSIGYASSVASGPDDIESLGDVYIWGEVWTNGISSDGLGSQTPSKIDVLSPKALESNVVIDVYQIGSGVHHIALVTRQGEVFTWGEESGGRLGHGSDKDFGQPHLVESLAMTSMSFVSCGEFHTCAVSTSGDLYTWGDGTHNVGLLGHGTNVSHWIPKRVSGLLEGLQVVSLSCGSWHSALTTSNGKLFTFGDGRFGVLGHGDRESVSYPKEVQLSSGQKAIKVACGVWHTAAIIEVTDPSGSNALSRKQLFTWGDGDQYRLGHVSKETYLQPTCVSTLSEYDFQQVACGNTMTVALTVSGHVFIMGINAYGQLGNPLSDGKVPILVRDKLVGECVEEISCGAHHVAVLTSRSELYTWGGGANGRLGHGDTDDQKSPKLVEAFKDRHVKNISCGSNFTTCICIHKWVSGADQSLCTGCRQPFGFTKKRHNCYNCGLVHCHGCSSKKAMKAALAPTPGKPHRVCDNCYAKLKGSISDSGAFFNKEATRPRSSVYGSERLPRGEVRSSRTLLSPITEPVKYLEIRTSKSGSKHDSSSIVRASQVPSHLQLKDVAFPSSLSAMQNNFKPVILPSQPPVQPPIQPPTPPAPVISRPTSPYARKPSPPRSTSPGFSRSLIDSLKKKNELLNLEVSKLQKQIRNLKQRSDMQEMKIEGLQKDVQGTASLAGEESSKHRVTKEFLKCITDQLSEVTEKLPPDISGTETLRIMQAQAKDFLQERVDFQSSSAPDIPASESDAPKPQEQRLEQNYPSIDEGNVLQENKRLFESSAEMALPTSSTSASLDLYKSTKEGETSVIEQFERGVYITAVVLPSGGKVFKRVRFSKRKFDEQRAEEWWNQNKDRVFKKYSPAGTKDAAGTGSFITRSHSEENVDASSSSKT
ncbi:hypothetical protein Lal_00028310 [Lupinus albus]|uniref:Putative chromatin regulator PHD family n=1 Tax=Lupinus albus TaxID=3870 RepID=A0A6A5NN78_LUPAL|nr:putative chromatin regulator PHD family [Lupinus albus]KAF1884432.1 hypothetical protein Lal_00028310 [Lupinus albus]